MPTVLCNPSSAYIVVVVRVSCSSCRKQPDFNKEARASPITICARTPPAFRRAGVLPSPFCHAHPYCVRWLARLCAYGSPSHSVSRRPASLPPGSPVFELSFPLQPGLNPQPPPQRPPYAVLDSEYIAAVATCLCCLKELLSLCSDSSWLYLQGWSN